MATAAMAAAIGAIIAIVIAIVIAIIFLLIFVVAFCRTQIYEDTNIRKRVLQSQYGAIGQQEEVTTLVQQPMVMPQPVMRQVIQELPALPPPQPQIMVQQCQPEQICLPPAARCVRRNSCYEASPYGGGACGMPMPMQMPSRCLTSLDLATPPSCSPCGGGGGYGAVSYNACSRPMNSPQVFGYRTGSASPACAPAALTSVVPVMASTNSCFQTTYVAGNACSR